MSNVKHIDLSEFIEQGFLQEANRLFFHPLGLALEIDYNEDTGKPFLSGVWDYRDDPEGIIYNWAAWNNPEETIKSAWQKHSNVTKEVKRHREAREKLFKKLYPDTISSEPTIEPLIVPKDG